MPTPASCLIRGAIVITLDPAIGDLPSGDILVVGDRIKSVAAKLDAPVGAKVIDATGMIAIPGLINGHMHTWQTGLRGTAGDMTLRSYFGEIHEGVGRHISPEDTHIATLVGALNQINSGVTSLFDWHHANHSIDHTDAAVDALEASGIRAVYGHGTSRRRIDASPATADDLRHPRDRIERLRKGRLAGDAGLVTLAMCLLGPALSPFDVVSDDIRLARDLGIGWSLHTGANGMPSVTEDAIPRMAKAGLLGPDGNFVHAINYSDDDLRHIIGDGSTISIAPEVEMQFGHGIPVTGRVLALGGLPSIGIDLEALHVGDMFIQMRTALQSQRGFDAVDKPKPLQKLISTARDALRWATIGNAYAMGQDTRIGSLSPGKQADITLVRATDLNMAPVHDPVKSIVLQAGAHNVDTVMIAGNLRKRNGRLDVPKPKLAALLGKLEDSARRLAAHLPSSRLAAAKT